MGTRSNIIVRVKPEDIGRVLTHEFKGNTYETKIEKPYVGIYCQWNGYIDGVGRALIEYYNDYEKALELISGGFTSNVTDDNPDYYMAWERDEKWSSNHPRQSDDLKVCVGWTVYAYIFDNGKWYVGLVEWHNDDTYTIEDVVELTDDVLENGHPKEREEEEE